MGSATMALGDDTITRRADIWRFATPAYAAPEMLTQDIEGIAALRRSPAIDVYALSSILYQLYSGRKPFDVESTGAAATGSFYLIKTKTKPAPLEPRCEGDEALVQIIMKGLSVEQCDRPTEQQMLEVLSAYLTDAESEGREGTGDEAAIDIDSGTHLKVDVAGERAREILEQARHDAMTRRRFIIGGAIAAVAGLSVIGAATHGFGIPDYLDGIRGSLDDYTWDQLQEISLKIKAAETRSEAREIAKRYTAAKTEENGDLPVFDTPEKIAAFLRPRYIGVQVERAYLLLFDNAMHMLDFRHLGDGEVSKVLLSVRQIAEYAFRKHAAQVVLAHNHPGGIAVPSGEDLALTRRVSQALQLLDIPLLEHFIFSDYGYCTVVGKTGEEGEGGEVAAAGNAFRVFSRGRKEQK